MVVTRNSQQSSEPTEVESISKLIAKRKEEKWKEKKSQACRKRDNMKRFRQCG